MNNEFNPLIPREIKTEVKNLLKFSKIINKAMKLTEKASNMETYDVYRIMLNCIELELILVLDHYVPREHVFWEKKLDSLKLRLFDLFFSIYL
jgi:hypothetical protein